MINIIMRNNNDAAGNMENNQLIGDGKVAEAGNIQQLTNKDIYNSSIKIIGIGDMGEVDISIINRERNFELPAAIIEPKPALFKNGLTYLVTQDYENASWENLLPCEETNDSLSGVTNDKRLAVLSDWVFCGKIKETDVGVVINPWEDVITALKNWRKKRGKNLPE